MVNREHSCGPYDLSGIFDEAISHSRRSGEACYIVQNAMGYTIERELRLPLLYRVWKINADGGISDSAFEDREPLPQLVSL